jgi:hypothetical protein
MMVVLNEIIIPKKGGRLVTNHPNLLYVYATFDSNRKMTIARSVEQ